MPAKQSSTGKRPSSPNSSQPATDNPFTSRNHTRNNPQALSTFNIRNFLTRRTSSEILADLSQTRTSPPPSSPTPHSPPSTPAFRTPESTPSTRRPETTTPSSTASKRSLDTDGDVKMRNGVFTTPERLHIQQRHEIRAAVRDAFEYERARLAEEVKRRVLDEVEGFVRERVAGVLCAAVGEPAGSEVEEVVAVRERLGRMSDGARGEDSSPASFEKTLSALSAKITDTQSRLDGARATSRRIRVLWSLYLAFAYLVYSIVIFLVVGWNGMGVWEWTGVCGGPVVIYLTRTTVTAFFNYRIDSLSTRLKEQQTERAKTIQKLKDATKYDSTLELLEKYGGSENKNKKQKQGASGDDDKKPRQQVPRHHEGSRTNMPPPPTANIQRPGPGSPPPGFQQQHHQRPPQQQPNGLEPTEEFAPNAYGSGHPPPPPPPTQSQHFAQMDGVNSSHWYDRIMDLLLGEDETASKNRIVLICARCRLVNGQAPPGTKALSELGTWKCMGCGATNGEMDEGKRIMREVLGSRAEESDVPTGEEFKESDDDDEVSSVEIKEEEGDDDVHGAGAKTTGRQGASGTTKRKGKGGK
ncbi:hypothetical protein CkaCkLH20_10573 [Colletotrichum karsti]|uniref:Endoplasmic reticulum junction formation protein lunapark n=1 Tax=Colletotrichum karsti TaxID=1095194 RepID=A0A9P6I0U7_9PEZI|nr:uncharacterized protein CkaCkLH20_10573 [Colletotrichum karsti]KAF9871941.1 hypothetical protein CkaCkLH20_10573 [Colletotrichum karsti]